MRKYIWMWPQWREVSRVIAWLALTLAVIYFVNGLTRPDASVVVRLTADGTEAAVEPSGWIEPGSQTAVFHFGDITYVSERISTRLGLVFLLLVIATIAFALEQQAKRFGPVGPGWFVVPSRYATAIGIAVAALGFMPGIGQWLASASVLLSAGKPVGLEPQGSFNLGWIVAGAGYLGFLRAARRVSGRASIHESRQPR
jgi:hypothetical protein